MKIRPQYFGYTTLLLFLGSLLALAQSADSTTQKTAPGAGIVGILIAYWICNSRKRRPIGGWLLYYYMQLFGGALISFSWLFGMLENFNSELWDNPALYTLYLISTIPAYIVTLGEVTVGSMLLSHRFRNPQTVNWLRIVFVVSFVFGLIALLIDSAHWPESIAFDLLPVVGSILWFLYFTRSKRVQLVFKERNWDPNIIYPTKLA